MATGSIAYTLDPDKKIQLCAAVDRHSKQRSKGSSNDIYITVATKSKQKQKQSYSVIITA